MSFNNVLNRVRTWDNPAYIRVNIIRFCELENMPVQFYEAIKKLSEIREGLIVLQQSGMLEQVENGLNSYKIAIDWLKLNSPISNGIAVSAITSFDDINESIAASFLQYVNWLKASYFNRNQEYQNAKLAIGVAKADKLKMLAMQAEEYSESLNNETEKAKIDIEKLSNDKQDQLINTLNDLLNQHILAMQNSESNAIANIKQAQALNIWHEAYQQNITEYKTKLYGVQWRVIDFKKRFFDNRKQRRREVSYEKSRPLLKWMTYYFLYVPTRSIRFLVTLLYRVVYWSFKKVSSLSGRRLLWFFILGLVTVAQSAILLSLILNGHGPNIHFTNLLSGNSIANLISSEYILAKIGIYIGFIVVPSLGYSFANKNYRIYSNLLDQYKQRATVAQTLQGILRNIDETSQNKDIRVNLVSVAAVAMFEMKNIGHLTKRDNDSSIISTLLSSLTGGKSS